MTRMLVCGSRDFVDRDRLFAELDRIARRETIVAVIEGEQRGADVMAREWAKSRGYPWVPFPADWKKLGTAAGSIRNSQMLNEGKPDLVVAFPLPGSRGTWDMVRKAQAVNVHVIVL